MKLIKCIIRPEKADEVVAALQGIVPGMTVSELAGHGRQKGQPLLYRGVEYAVHLLPKTLIELVVDDDRVDEIVGIVNETARTGSIGDGRIFVFPVERTFHIRTGFMDLG